MAARIPALLPTKAVRRGLATSQVKLISTFSFLSQEPVLATEHDPSSDSSSNPIPLPPNPATGSPIYNENWRSPLPFQSQTASSSTHIVAVPGFPQAYQMQSMSQALDAKALLDLFAGWMTSLRWVDIKQLFEFWVRSLDRLGKPNKPTVELYNHYLRANLMVGATVGDLLDLIARMEDFVISPNTASFNLVLKAMIAANEFVAAEKLLQRMEVAGDESVPDDESYDLVIRLLFQQKQTDAAFKYVENALKSGRTITVKVFSELITACLKGYMLDKLVSIIEKCKTMDQNKAICPSWSLCNSIADVAIRTENSKLTLYALEFMAKWIARGEAARPIVPFSINERLAVAALQLASKTCSTGLLTASWAVLHRSLRNKKPSPQAFLAKINSYASLGNLEKAVGALREFETAYESQDVEMLSPFSSLYPLVVACSSKGFETLDMVYFQLESLSRGERPYKSVAALNCVILGCSNIWDLVRSYQTFEAISASFGLTPDIHSFNCLMHAYGKQKGISEVNRVFNHMVSLGVKPNLKSYSLLVDAHLSVRDPKSALAVVDAMVSAGFEPSREMLKKIRRRCIREMDYDSNDMVQSLAKRFNISMGTETSRDLLFSLDYSTSFNRLE